MKLRLLALAAGLAAASTAHALTPADIVAARSAGTLKEISISGASALRLSIASYVTGLCKSGTLHVYFNQNTGGTSKDGDNHRAYACELNATVPGSYAANTPVVIYKRDAGGSGQGVNPIALNTAISHLKIVDNGTCAATANTTFTDIQTPQYLCNSTTAVENRVSDAGISDVEPNILNQQPNLADVSATDITQGAVSPVNMTGVVSNSFVQGIFAVAVNKQAYFALQQTQFPSQTAGKTIADIDTLPQPSLPSGWVRSALTSGTSASNASQRGWGMVIGTGVDASVHTKTMNVCRRAPGSGTQAATAIFFGQNPCAGGSAGAYALARKGTSQVPVATGTTSIVNEQSGTGGVETCLGTTVEGIAGAYGIAVLGRENNPLANGGDKGYRYVKLDGAAPTRAEAAVGNYGFVYESTMQWNTNNPGLDTDKKNFLDSIRTNAPKPASLAKADADTQEGVMSPPGSWALLGNYPALSANDKAFASRVSRSAGNSCSVLRLTR